MTEPRTVLVVARDAHYRGVLASTLQDSGYDVLAAADRDDAIQRAEGRTLAAIVVDVQATGSFVPLPEHTGVPAIVIANEPNDSTLRALRARAQHVLVKPVTMDDLADAVANAKRARALAGAGRLVARSPAMRKLMTEVERLRDSDCTVLVLGETGTGKTVLARRIHEIGARSSGAFVDMNCAGLTAELVESELFGHERGSFTGAHMAKQGLFDVAHQGTLFLDEIGDIDLRVQPRVLKVLEEKRFRRMGDVRERSVDVRLIAATHQDLLGAVAKKGFRADLYYRISTVRLVVPSLRDRREDIMPLTCEMLDRIGASGLTVSRDAEQRLCEYSWPGNIRELKNVIESSTLLRRGATLTADDLRFDVPAPPPSDRFLLAAEASDATSAELEREHIRFALMAENGRVAAAAKRLGVPRSTLYWKLKRFNMKANGDVAF